MDYQVALSFSARSDLLDIVRYISFDTPQNAVSFGRFLVSKVRLLGRFPEMGRIVHKFNDTTIRKIVVRSYRVIYRVGHIHQKVDVIRFWHGTRGNPRINA